MYIIHKFYVYRYRTLVQTTLMYTRQYVYNPYILCIPISNFGTDFEFSHDILLAATHTSSPKIEVTREQSNFFFKYVSAISKTSISNAI